MSTTINTNDLIWSGVLTTAGDGTMTTDTSKTLATTIERVRPIPGHHLTITTTIAAAIGTTGAILVQGHLTTITSGLATTVAHDVDPLRPLTIQLTNVAAATVHLELTAPDDVPDHAEPWQVLALDVMAPIATDALQWDAGRWDRAAWDSAAPVPGTLVWDSGQWDAAYWYDSTVTQAWTSILGPCTTISTRRGVATTGPILTAQTGTLSLQAIDLDPRALGIVYGAPIRLYHWPSRAPIFTGYVSGIAVIPLKAGGSTCTIDAVDDVAPLATITRYGARPTGGGNEPWDARIARLMVSAPDMAYEIAGSTTELVCPTVWETSLANHLDACIATSGGAWWARRAGGIIVAANLPNDLPALVLTDNPATHHSATCWHYHDGAASWSTAALTSQIEATNHTAEPDETGDWKATDTTITVTETTTAAAWGGAAARVDLMATDPTTATIAARRLLRRASTTPTMTTAVTDHVNHRRPRPTQAARMLAAAQLDPLTPVTAAQRGETARALVAAVAHAITPTAWTTTTDLTQKETTA